MGNAVVVAPTTAPANTEKLQKEGSALVDAAKQIKVTSETSYEGGGQFMRGVKTFERGVNAEFKPIEDAHKAARTATKALKDKVLAPIKEATALVDPQMRAFQEKKRKAREEQERKQREAAEEKARKEREKELKRLDKQAKVDPEAQAKKEELEEAPLEVEAQADKRPIPKVDGVAGRQIWKFRITDKQALLQACAAGTCPTDYIKIDQAAIGKVVRGSKGQVKIPGVTPYPEESTTYGSME